MEEENEKVTKTFVREINSAEIKLGHKIASGFFSQVYLGRFEGKYVAVKKIVRNYRKQSERDLLEKEIAIMRFLLNSNILLEIILGLKIIYLQKAN